MCVKSMESCIIVSNFLKVVGFQPSLVPYDYLGPVGVFLHYMAYDLNTLTKLL